MDESYEQRKADLAGNQLVKKPITRLDVDLLPTKKQNRYKMTPRKMLAGINKYFAWCEKEDELPSISGMMIHMKLYQAAFYHYVKDPRYRDLLEQAKMVIQNWVEKDIYTSKGLATGKIAYAKNILNWVERTENTNTSIQIEMSPEAARAKIEALAPKLLEALKSSTLLNQLVKDDSPLLIDVTPTEKAGQ